MKKIMVTTTLIITTILTSHAEEKIEFPLSTPELGVVTHERKLHFTVRDYTPPVAFHLNPKEESSLPLQKTPEKAAIVHFNAMLDGDYNLWLSLWDDASRVSIVKEHKAKNQSPEFWKKWWLKAFFEFDTFELTRRVDTGKDVIIEMRASKEGETPLFVDVPLTQDLKGYWRATEKLAKDPVFINWRSKNKTITTEVRKAPKVWHDFKTKQSVEDRMQELLEKEVAK